MGVAQNFNFDKGVLGSSLTSTFYKVPTVRDFIKMASEASLALLAKKVAKPLRRFEQQPHRLISRSKIHSGNDRLVSEVNKEMRIGILSDTHGLLRQEVIDKLKGVDMIIHAGDIDNQSVVDQLKELSSSLTIVRGNADKEWAEQIPQEAWLEILGNKLFVIHNKGKISCDVGDADIIIYGHSHKYSLVEESGQIWFNPGCCGKRKRYQEISFSILEIRGKNDFNFRKISIGNNEETEKLPKDIDKIIAKAMRLTDKGMSYEDIASKLKISKELSRSICRMYLTHPGVDVAGILKRICV